MESRIFVTVGSQKFQFDRLLKKIDELCKTEIISTNVFAQIGYSSYIPKYYKYKRFLDRNEFETFIKKSDIVITHGGTGAIVNAIKNKKKVIAVPRLSKYGEHVDNHQLQIIEEFEALNFICSCYEVCDLERSLDNVKKTIYNDYVSNTDKFVKEIDSYIKEIKKSI